MSYRKIGYLEQITYILLWVIKDKLKNKSKKERTDADAES